MGRRLDRISVTGLKRTDLRGLDLGAPVVVVHGPNGAGKTGLAQAIGLLALGARAAEPRTPDGVMLLARGGDAIGAAVEVRGVFSDGFKASRRWERTEALIRGVVTSTITATATAGGVSGRDAGGVISAALGGWAETWRPGEALLDLSPDKLRRRLLVLLGAEGELPAELAAACPRLEDEELDAWCERARDRAAARVSDAARRVRQLEGETSAAEFHAPPAMATLRARVAELHAEIAGAQALADLDRELAAARSKAAMQIAELAAGAGPSVEAAARSRDEAEAALEEARARYDDGAKARGAWEAAALAASGEVKRLEREAGDLRARAAGRLAELWQMDEADQALRAARAAEEEAAARFRRVELATASVRGLVRVLEGAPPIACCPGCGLDLRVELGRQLEAAREGLARTEAEEQLERERLRVAAGAVHAAARELEEVRAGVELELALAEVEAARLEVWHLREAEPPAPVAIHAEVALVRERREALRTAERLERDRLDAEAARSRAVAERDAAAARVEELERRREELPPARPVAEVAAELAAAEAELEAGARVCGRIEAQADQRAELSEARAELLRAEELRERLADYAEALLERVRGRLEGPLSERCGAEVRIRMVDARGASTCRITRAGVDVRSLSVGERIRFVAGLLEVLGASSGAAWRPLFLDGFEGVSAEHRAGLLEALVQAEAAGRIDQAFVFGCPDSIPEVPGVRVIRLEGGQYGR